MNISFEQFKSCELVVGKILSVEAVSDTQKLLNLSVDLGEENPRTIVSGVKEFFQAPEELVGKNIVVVKNLEPREIKGIMSEGMILAAKDDEGLSLIVPDRDISPGTAIS
jgi:methionyl-tRNA synthetase